MVQKIFAIFLLWIPTGTFACRIVCMEKEGAQRVLVLCDERSQEGTYDIVEDSGTLVPPEYLNEFQSMKCRFSKENPGLSFCRGVPSIGPKGYEGLPASILKTKVIKNLEMDESSNLIENERMLFEGYVRDVDSKDYKLAFKADFSFGSESSKPECMVNTKR